MTEPVRKYTKLFKFSSYIRMNRVGTMAPSVVATAADPPSSAAPNSSNNSNSLVRSIGASQISPTAALSTSTTTNVAQDKPNTNGLTATTVHGAGKDNSGDPVLNRTSINNSNNNNTVLTSDKVALNRTEAMDVRTSSFNDVGTHETNCLSDVNLTRQSANASTSGGGHGSGEIEPLNSGVSNVKRVSIGGEVCITGQDENIEQPVLTREEFASLSENELWLKWQQQQKITLKLSQQLQTHVASVQDGTVPVAGGTGGDSSTETQTELREANARLNNQLAESQRKEAYHVMRLTAKEHELQEMAASVAASKCFSVGRCSLLDPAVNLSIERLKRDLDAARTKMEEAQNELAAWKFTPDSNTGKQLMAKCRLLIKENEELGRVISSGRLAKLEGDLALQRNFTEELKKSQSDLDEFLLEMDEDTEGMQGTILYLQHQLRTAKQQLQQLTNTSNSPLPPHTLSQHSSATPSPAPPALPHLSASPAPGVVDIGGVGDATNVAPSVTSNLSVAANVATSVNHNVTQNITGNITVNIITTSTSATTITGVVTTRNSQHPQILHLHTTQTSSANSFQSSPTQQPSPSSMASAVPSRLTTSKPQIPKSCQGRQVQDIVSLTAAASAATCPADASSTAVVSTAPASATTCSVAAGSAVAGSTTTDSTVIGVVAISSAAVGSVAYSAATGSAIAGSTAAESSDIRSVTTGSADSGSPAVGSTTADSTVIGAVATAGSAAVGSATADSATAGSSPTGSHVAGDSSGVGIAVDVASVDVDGGSKGDTCNDATAAAGGSESQYKCPLIDGSVSNIEEEQGVITAEDNDSGIREGSDKDNKSFMMDALDSMIIPHTQISNPEHRTSVDAFITNGRKRTRNSSGGEVIENAIKVEPDDNNTSIEERVEVSEPLCKRTKVALLGDRVEAYTDIEEKKEIVGNGLDE